MGLFGGKESCVLCGGKTSALSKLKIVDGTICGDCRSKCSPLSMSLQHKNAAAIRAHIQDRENNALRYQQFTPTDTAGDLLHIDRNTQTFCCPRLGKKNPDIFSFSELIDFELVEDGVSVTKGGLGSAVVGGAVFGGVGAIVGSNVGKKQKDMVSKMSVIVNLRNEFVSKIDLPLITVETKKASFGHKAAKELGNQVMALLSVVSDTQAAQSAPQAPVAPISDADELLKFKQLLDAGIITQEEFDAKKKQILGL